MKTSYLQPLSYHSLFSWYRISPDPLQRLKEMRTGTKWPTIKYSSSSPLWNRAGMANQTFLEETLQEEWYQAFCCYNLNAVINLCDSFLRIPHLDRWTTSVLLWVKLRSNPLIVKSDKTNNRLCKKERKRTKLSNKEGTRQEQKLIQWLVWSVLF